MKGSKIIFRTLYQSSNKLNTYSHKSIIYQILNVVAVVSTIIINSLANIQPFNDVTTGQVSDSYPNLFTPPGYVFSIWGLIYVLSIVFMIYQVRPSQRVKDYLKEIGPLYLICAIINISWLFLFHYSYRVSSIFLVSVIDLLFLLVVLILIYVRLGIGKVKILLYEKIAVHLPISIYLGWISLASIAGIASALNVLISNISITNQAYGTAIMIIVAVLLSSLMLFKRRDLAFVLVVIWALVGIAFKNMDIQLVSWTAISATILLFLEIIYLFIITKR